MKKRIQMRKPRKRPTDTKALPPVAATLAAMERNLDDRPEVLTLLRSIKEALPSLEHVLSESEVAYEGRFYRCACQKGGRRFSIFMV